MPIARPTSFEIGAIIDKKYRIESPLKQGGMGEVYRATHIALNRTVAIKTLRPQFLMDETAVQRFYREARLAASIGHDNICEVIDIGTTEHGFAYLEMPLLRGNSLADLLKKETILPLSRLGDIVLQTLSALEATHQANIVHRDLKPDNIFVTRIGDRDDFVKLLDFGISKIINQDSVSMLTKTGVLLGTPHYMSPEQAQGAKVIDRRVDIYSVGVILYEALAGRCPFNGDNYNEILFNIMCKPFQRLKEINPSIPESVERIILKAMSRDACERYTNATEMRTALEQAIVEADQTDFTPLTSSGTASSDGTPFSPTELTESLTPVSSAVETDKESNFANRPWRVNTTVIVSLAFLVIIIIGIVGYSVLDFVGEQSEQHVVTPALPVSKTTTKQTQPDNKSGAELPTITALPKESQPFVHPEKCQDQKNRIERSNSNPRRSSLKAKWVKRVERVNKKPIETEQRGNATMRRGEDQEPEAAKKDDKNIVKGRFGTKFISEY